MTYFASGQYNAICDRCGFKFKSSELRKDWQGLMVCDKDFEQRHPQDFIRVRSEKLLPEWVRPRTPDSFIESCDLWGISGYADLATADCMRADNSSLSYLLLYNLKNGM